MLYNKEKQEQIINSLTLNCIDLSCKQVKKSEFGFIDNNTLLALQLNSMLLGAFENIEVYSYERQNSFENLYSTIKSYG